MDGDLGRAIEGASGVTADGRPNLQEALGGLKDFQRATVEYVFRRMYVDQPSQRRFLVADEVGLGKTLVARGVIAKAIDHLWETVDRIDVVYICSNADIARQNINRLRQPGASEFTLASRLTMLPVQVQDLKHSRLNLVSLTPGTSFDPKSKLGSWTERALLYLLLRDAWSLKGAGPLNLLQGNMHAERFRQEVQQFEKTRTIDEDLAGRFREELDRQPHLQERFTELLGRFGRTRTHVSPEDARERRRLVGELRGCLAATCIEALEPDLVILDEFQRFKDLMDGEDEAASLARHLFEWSRDEEQARVLLLSATPYKMYTLTGEQEGEDHYADFLRTIRFLSRDEGVTGEIDRTLRCYRSLLYRLADGDGGELASAKADLESRLRRVMARTERLAATDDRDGMLQDAKGGDLDLVEDDVAAYRSLHRLAQQLDEDGRPNPVEFWKSSPYLLSFMEDYDLKRRLEERQGHPPSAAAIAEILHNSTGLSLSRRDIENYAALDPCNARLRWLLTDTVERGAWRLLWMPPSMPYYRPESDWAVPELADFTKRLVFSSWHVVPRMVAAMTSYAAERAAVSSLEDPQMRWSELRERLRGPLRLTVRDGQPTGMSVLALMCPSAALAALADPLDWVVSPDRELARVRAEVRARVSQALTAVGATARSGAVNGAGDERWYWVAPILLDHADSEEATRTFLDDEYLAGLWAGATVGEDEENGGWERHLEEARKALAGELDLGSQPSDLADVLTDLAIAGPGTVALRALYRVTQPITLAERVIARQQAASIAWAFRNLFNLAESVALLRGLDAREPYWRRVLQYCAAGNLQAVLDEYTHVLVEALGLGGQRDLRVLHEIGGALRDAISLRTSTPGFDEVVANDSGFDIIPRRLRARFAARFGTEPTEGDEKQAMRADQVRHAFNSPFWPFVLATTSIGQEGLDFHPYCHAVVHWNLPSNPVDLEQREGRVHRYNGHAVRKTVACRHRGVLSARTEADPWNQVFASAAACSNGSELVPCWIHGDPCGVRIERHVPVLPLSRDVLRFARLRRALVLYRMVFGQPRQDDLIAYLNERLPEERVREQLDAMQIDLQPPAWEGPDQQARVPAPLRSAVHAEGPLGRAVLRVLDRYPLVLDRGGAKKDHVVARALAGLAAALAEAGLSDKDRLGWSVDYKRGQSWLPVPLVWMSDERRRVHRHDDLRVELLLDCHRDGVHVALGAQLDPGSDRRFSLQTARLYQDVRRDGLRDVLDPMTQAGFRLVPPSEFLQTSEESTTAGVGLVVRFLYRSELERDAPLLEALRHARAAYERAYELKLARPDGSAKALLG